MFLLTEYKSRPTRDIDFLAQQISNDTENIKEVFNDICSIEYNDDGVRFDSDNIEVTDIKKDADYQGVRVKVNCYLGNARKAIQLDIGFGDVVVPKASTMECPILIDMSVPMIKVYSLESVVSEKFQAMIALSDLNSRMKDFYDIYTILNKYCFDGRRLQEAVSETIQRRHTIIERDSTIFSDEFAQDENRNKMWKAFLRKINEKNTVDFKDIMRNITVFLKPIYDTIVLEKEFLMQWDNKKREWCKYGVN